MRRFALGQLFPSAFHGVPSRGECCRVGENQSIDWFSKIKILLVGVNEDEFELTERRGQHRPECDHAIEIRAKGQPALKGRLVDLSPTGLKVHCPQPLEAGATVTVSCSEVTGRQRTQCRVVWVSRGETNAMGLTFTDSEENLEKSWVRMALKQLGFEGPWSFQARKSRRVEVSIPLEVQSRECVALSNGVTVDVGAGGALLKLPISIAPGEFIRLAMITDEFEPAIPVLARVLSRRREDQVIFHHVQFVIREDDPKLKQLFDSLRPSP